MFDIKNAKIFMTATPLNLIPLVDVLTTIEHNCSVLKLFGRPQSVCFACVSKCTSLWTTLPCQNTTEKSLRKQTLHMSDMSSGFKRYSQQVTQTVTRTARTYTCKTQQATASGACRSIRLPPPSLPDLWSFATYGGVAAPLLSLHSLR